MPNVLIPIRDGNTLSGKTTTAFYPTITFKYRKVLPEKHFDYVMESQNASNGKQRMDAIVSILTGSLLSWDITDDKDNPLPVTDENLRQTPSRLLENFVDAVCGVFDRYTDDQKK